MAPIRFTTVGFLAALAVTAASPRVWSQGAAPESATTPQKMEARLSFSKGMKSFNAKKFDEALTHFKTSYGAVASPNSHLMIARTIKNMGQRLDAYQEYQAVVSEARAAAAKNPKYQKAADAGAQDLAALGAEIGLVRVTGTGSATADAQLTVGGRVIERDRWDQAIPVEPGAVTVQLTGGSPKSVDVPAGSTTDVDLSPPPPVMPVDPVPDDGPNEPSSYEGPDRMTMTYIAGGVGALGLITWGIFGGLALSKHGDIEDQCVNNRCPANLQSDADEGEAYVVVSNVGFAVGLVGILAGAGFFTWQYLDEKDDSDSEGDELAGELSVGPGSVHMKMQF
jgi:hypothetical protein